MQLFNPFLSILMIRPFLALPLNFHFLYSYLVWCGQSMTIDTVYRDIEFTLQKPSNIAFSKATINDSFKWL